MGMGNYACHADTVELKFVESQCPELFNNLSDALSKASITYDAFAMMYDEYQGDDRGELDEADEQAISEAYEKLQAHFETMTGLTLLVRYHTREDRGDEVDGCFWEVEGVYQLTPAGKKWQTKIERKFWTTFG